LVTDPASFKGNVADLMMICELDEETAKQTPFPGIEESEELIIVVIGDVG